MNASDGWKGILEDDEKILWQGRPLRSFRPRITQLPTFLFGSAFAGFALFWMIMAAAASDRFWMFGLIHFVVGLGVALGPIVLDHLLRKNTWYTLTNRRAFIATDMPMAGRKLKSYPINRSTLLTLQDGDPPSVYFAEEYRTTKNGSRRMEIGFEAIPDGRDVMELMRSVQKGVA